jgi:hypothetical protein
MVTVITETGAVIPLEGDLQNGGAAAEAYVLAERRKLKLPDIPPKAKAKDGEK